MTRLRAANAVLALLRPTPICVAALMVVALATGSPAQAQQLLTNGDFETGAFAPWVVTDLAGGSGSFFIDTPGTTTPISGIVTSPGPSSFYAVSDQTGPGTHALTQSFTVPALAPRDHVILSFDMFVNDWSGVGPIVDPIGLDHTGPPNQHARVDILTAAAPPFDTGAGVVGNIYLGVDPGPTPNPFVHYSVDITSMVSGGGTYQIRFAEVDNQNFFNQGVDNVSIEIASFPVPTLNTWAIAVLVLLLLIVGVMVIRLRMS